jgi:hypothetical protein
MSEINESGVLITSWRIAASTVHLCDRCQACYAGARFCDACLREANANPGEKRGILFPYAYDAVDTLSAIA